MPDFDISGQHHHHQQFDVGDKEKGNISIKHTTGHHANNVTQRDMIQASTNSFQEEYVPPVDTPVLEPYDPNASNQPPKPKPEKPGAKFKNNFENELHHLPASTLKSIASTPHEARAMLRFAHANPDVPMDPKVTELLQTLVEDAAQETRDEMNLGMDWQPPEPHTGEFNAHISDRLNSNFEHQLKENFSGSDYKSLRLAYYHPELRSQLNPELQSYLNEMTQSAYDQTQSEMGFPSGWEPPPDSSALDDVVNGHFAHTFDEEVSKQKDLTTKERKELRTLFRFPNAKVPDKEKLQELLKALTDKAHASAKERFGLPDNFKLSHQSHLFKLALMGEFGNHFQKEVLKKLRNGEITHEQAQKLIASKGIDPSKVPANLQNAYTQMRQTAAKQTANDYALPENWQPSETSNETPPGEANGTSATNQQGTVRNADGSVRVQANTPVQAKGLQSQQSQPIDPMTAPASNRDYNTALKAINYYKQAITATSNITAKYFTGPEHMYLGDSMLVVSDALDNLRESVSTVQVAESNAARAVMRGQNDAQEEKIRKELKDMMKAPPKQFFLFKILNVIPIVSTFSKQIETAIKLIMWAVNVLTGGAVSMITQAIGMESIEENPLEMVGMISHDAAEKMDMALGIIVMVAEMAVEAVLAQPELVAAEVAGMTAEIAAEAGEDIGEAVAEVTTQVTAEAAAEAGTAAGTITAETISNITSRVMSQTMTKVLEKAVDQSVKLTVKQAAKEGLKEAIQNQAKAIARKIFNKVREIAEREVRQQVTKVQNYKQAVTDFVKDPVQFAQGQFRDFTTNIGKTFTGGVGKVDELEGIGGKGGRGARGGVKGVVKGEAKGVAKGEAKGAAKGEAKGAAKGEAKGEAKQTADSESSQADQTEAGGKPNGPSKPAAKAKGEKAEGSGEGGKGEGDGGEVGQGDGSGAGKVGEDGNYGETTMTEQDRELVEDKKAEPEDKAEGDKGTGEAGSKELDEVTQSKVDASKLAKMKEAVTEELQKTLKRSIEKKVKQELKAKGIKVVQKGFKQTISDAKGLSKVSAGKQWVTNTIKDGIKTGVKKAAEATKLDKVANKANQGVNKVKGKLNETKAGKVIGKVATEISERTSSADTLIKQAAKEYDAGDMEAFQRKLLKAAAKRTVERQQNNIRFMMDIKDYMQNTIQFASYTAQTIMYMKKAEADLKAARDQAFIQEMDTYVEMDKKAEDALMQGMTELAGWINDINQQESTFWKKMEIRFIAA